MLKLNKVLCVIEVAAIAVTMTTAYGMAAESNKTLNNELKAGTIVNLEYSETPDSPNVLERRDSMYIEIDGYVYLYKDYAEDMAVGDDVLVIVNTKGTEDRTDDIVRDWKYWTPDAEPDYINEVQNGSCVGARVDVQKLQTNLTNVAKGLCSLKKITTLK